MLKQVQHDVWKDNSQEPTAKSQQPKAKSEKTLHGLLGRKRWVTAAKALNDE
jgi:hypothetical protein